MHKEKALPKFLIERQMPGAGKLGATELRSAAAKSCEVLRALGPSIQWLESYVTDDKVYCLYIAPDADTVREHAQRAGFPADSVSPVRVLIDPTTAE